MVEDLDGHGGRVTPVFVGEEDFSPDEFVQKRKDLLRRRPKNYMEGDEEVIAFDFSSPEPSTSQLSPVQAEMLMLEDRRKLALKRKDEKRTAMRLEGIEEESPDRSVSQSQDQQQQQQQQTVLSPEEYEDYIGDAVEKDYPESNLFLPTSTTSLPEISIEPPTPQAPKPKDGFDRENKVKYDLRVPGYRSMFLTVPGFDDDDCDRYLPKYSFDSDDEDESSSEDDDDVVHKPRVFASLADVAESRGLKRYGSSCDIAKFGMNETEEPIYSHEDDLNANFDANACKSKVGGTGSGPFVAGKLAMFEKVVEEEHQKFIECQEVRKRIFRAPKKSGEYIEKFYNPKVVETIDARANVRGRNLRYYDDEYDAFNNRKTPTPTEMMTPYGGYPSPQVTSKYTPYNSPRTPTPTPTYDSPRTPTPAPTYDSPRTPTPAPTYDSPRTPTPPTSSYQYPVTSTPPTHNYGTSSYSNDDFDFDAYEYVGERPRSQTSAADKTETRQCSPLPQPTVDNDTNYWRSTECSDYGRSEVTSPGPSTSAQPSSSRKMLDQRTDEVLELLDNSYLDMGPDGAGPSHESHGAPWQDECAGRGPVAGYSGYETPELPETDPLDDIFEIEDYDSLGSMTSIGGRHKRKAAAPPPPTSGNNNNMASTSTDTKRGGPGGFFARARREKDKDKDKDKEKKDKKKDKDKEKEKKDFFKKKEKDKERDPDKTAGKRFQLFGGAKKTSEPNTTDEASAKSPKKDKATKRRFFGRGKENFIGRSPHISHESDPQVARMAGDSFEQESIDLEGDTEVL
ncbi:hypothetical protein Hamer_G022656 [Homarus americanus]|uniref:Uncharacterized protein n=1 Tax=Homarus americanus TaxID=6706 RepID=A0A8J5MV73_HOMAM|nr:hypothetical protein Hamer_G022656 [Homarus americanus]